MTEVSFNFFEDQACIKFSRTLAIELGLYEAILLQRLHEQLDPEHNQNYRDGHYWVYNTLAQWHQQLPFMSVSSIKRAFESLKEKKIIISENLNPHKFCRMLWYRIDYEALAEVNVENSNDTLELCKVQNKSVDIYSFNLSKSGKCKDAKVHNAVAQNEPMENPTCLDVWIDSESTFRKAQNDSSKVHNPHASADSRATARQSSEVQNELIETTESDSSKSGKCKDGKVTNATVQNEPMQKVNLSKSLKDNISINNNIKKITLSPTSLSKKEAEAKLKDEREIKIKKMIQMFAEIVGEQVARNPELDELLLNALDQQLSGQMENWQTVCEHITQSKFLMGESSSHFKASLRWVLARDYVTIILKNRNTTLATVKLSSLVCLPQKQLLFVFRNSTNLSLCKSYGFGSSDSLAYLITRHGFTL